MAQRFTTTTGRKTLLVGLFLGAIVWAAFACKLDTRPIIKPHPPVESDDSDSGEHER